jgi:hypothetical protein
MRHQMIYARNTVPTGTITITRLRWRANGAATATTGGTWSNVTIQMCTSATPHTAPDATFANNYGADLTTVYTGPVTVASTIPSYPGPFYVDVPLTTPFTYSGPGDLLIEVSWAAGTYTGPGTAAQTTDYHIPAGTPAARVYSTAAGATTGAVNTSAGMVVNFDYTPDPFPASKALYGNDCYDSLYYELFTPAINFDLDGTAIRMQPNAIGGYDVSPVPLNFVAPVSAGLPAADDARSVQTLPFTFPFPGGSTTQIGIITNGFVWLDGTTTSTDFTSSVTELLTLAPRLCVAWTDWNVNPAGTGGNGTWHYDVISPTEVHATWNGVGAFGYSATYGGPVARTFQCKIFADGAVEYHYVSGVNPYYARDCVVGIKPGTGTYANTGNSNLTTLGVNPLSTASGTTAGLILDVDVLPRLGVTFNYVTSNIPATAAFTATVLSFAAVVPGLDLGFLGMPGCRQNIALAGSTTLGLVFTNPSGSLSVGIPNDPLYLGFPLAAQSVAFVAGVNPFGGLTSNGVLITCGN